LNITRTVVDLGAIKSNLEAIKALLPQNTGIIAVVKANAYGHGLNAVAHAAIQGGAACLGVAVAMEGAELRKNGITVPILVLGGTLPQQANIAVEYGLLQTVYSIEMVEALQARCEQIGSKVSIHIKIETGMNRLGVRPGEDLQKLLDCVKRSPSVTIEGAFSHFAVSENPDKSFTKRQFELFETAIRQCNEDGFYPITHISNSGGILDCPFAHLDMVRVGIAMYGLHPNGERTAMLKPALEWKTNVVQVKTVPDGETVSYGRIWQAEGDRVIATLPVGYADGYRRSLGNKACVLIHGKRAPVVGRVCMDHLMADVTGIAGVETGDEAVLLGRQGDEEVTVEELATLLDTISYEVLTNIGERVKREYIDG
jgi:alanine racemase